MVFLFSFCIIASFLKICLLLFKMFNINSLLTENYGMSILDTLDICSFVSFFVPLAPRSLILTLALIGEIIIRQPNRIALCFVTSVISRTGIKYKSDIIT